MQEQHSPVDSEVRQRMQEDWNRRAKEDAHFFVAFGRRDQDPEEFFATAAEVVKGLEWELRRLPGENPRARRALEIGCGPGRLLRPMSKHFGEIHGVDVSDEMIARASANLRGIPHAHAHHTSGADLAPFADDSFDFVYSYAVFQHIPSRNVVMQYLREAARVLKPGGFLRAQLNGMDETTKAYDTWSGVRIPYQQIQTFAQEQHMQLLAIEGVRTQYMWVTLRKGGASEAAGPECGIRRITNALNSEPAAPAHGRFASVTLWVQHLPPQADLNRLRVLVDGAEAFACYIGPREHDGLQQVNVMLPGAKRTGLVHVELFVESRAIAEPAALRVIPPGPRVPIVLSITDGVDLMSGPRIVTGSVKVTMEEVSEPECFAASLAGQPVRNIEVFCTDPLPPRYEINFLLPEGVVPGTHVLEMKLGHRPVARTTLEVAASDFKQNSPGG